MESLLCEETLDLAEIFGEKPPVRRSRRRPALPETTRPYRYWMPDEHERFLEAVQRYGWSDATSIAAAVQTRTPTQVRTHSQKYLIKLRKTPMPKHCEPNPLHGLEEFLEVNLPMLDYWCSGLPESPCKSLTQEEFEQNVFIIDNASLVRE